MAASEILFKQERNKKPVFASTDTPFPVQFSGSSVTSFGEGLVAQRTPIIELNSAYGTSKLRDVVTVTNSAAITSPGTGEILLSTGATASSTARLDSAERIRYAPGYACEVGIGIRIPTLPTGNQEAKWGVRSPNGNEGFYWGLDATGLYVGRVRDGTETKVRPADFDVDALDGSGPNAVDISVIDGYIWQIDFTWYGYGWIRYDVVAVVGNTQRVVAAHWLKVTGTTSVQSPNLPIFAEATNGGDASDFDVYVGGRQASIVGNYIPKFRVTSEYRGGVSTSTTTTPLVTFRNKVGFEDRSVQILSFDASVETEDCIIEFYIDATLTGASYATPTNATASETALEVDTSATAISGGTLVYTAFAPSGQANKEIISSQSIAFDIPENQPITMAARSVTSTGTIAGFFTMKEEW